MLKRPESVGGICLQVGPYRISRKVKGLKERFALRGGGGDAPHASMIAR